VDKSTKVLNDDAIDKATNLSQLAGTSLSTSGAQESVGQATSMPESFADLVWIHGADVTLLEELSRPLADCISPLSTPIPTTRCDYQPNVEETALIVYASPQSIVEEELADVTTEARLADMIPKTSISQGMRRKQKMANSSPLTKQNKNKSKGG